MFKYLITLFALMFFGISAHADMSIATGPDGGVYKVYCKDFQGISPGANIECIPTNGAVTNLKMCLEGKATACLVNPDQLFVAKEIVKDERVDNLAVITSLYWNRINMFSKRMDMLSFSQFNGKRIGTFGGAAASLDAMVALTGVKPGQIINYDKFQQLAQQTMIADYNAGKLDAIVGIGGGQIPWAKAIPQGSHPVGFDLWDKVKHLSVENGFFYRMKPLSYDNMEGSVMTLAVRTILVSARLYGPDDPETKSIQAFFADLNRQLPKIKTQAGEDKPFRTDWLEVSPMNEPSWKPWFPHLRATAPAPKKK